MIDVTSIDKHKFIFKGMFCSHCRHVHCIRHLNFVDLIKLSRVKTCDETFLAGVIALSCFLCPTIVKWHSDNFNKNDTSSEMKNETT